MLWENGLNPCFSGSYSLSDLKKCYNVLVGSLNPCFSGSYSLSPTVGWDVDGSGCLNPCFSGSYSLRNKEIECPLNTVGS